VNHVEGVENENLVVGERRSSRWNACNLSCEGSCLLHFE